MGPAFSAGGQDQPVEPARRIDPSPGPAAGAQADDRLPLTVASRRTLAESVVALDLVDPEGRDLPDWRPGAHVDLVFGPDRRIRQYSLCGDALDRKRWTIAVLREPEGRGGSRFLADDVHEGDVLQARLPRDHFGFSGDRDAVLIAGGIGITPLVPMIEALERSGRDWHLHYAGRSHAGMAFLDALQTRHGDRVSIYAGDRNARLDIGTILGATPAGTRVYACGPVRMLDEIAGIASDTGIELHLERFVAAEKADAGQGEDVPFEVELAQTGVSFTVPAGESILDLAEAAGAPTICSCLDGICGTCETRVLEGEPDHRDHVLDKSTTKTMMICVSRAKGRRLVLDL